MALSNGLDARRHLGLTFRSRRGGGCFSGGGVCFYNVVQMIEGHGLGARGHPGMYFKGEKGRGGWGLKGLLAKKKLWVAGEKV